MLFLYGMDLMGDSLKKLAGGRLESILARLTSTKWRGFLLGLVVTAVIQSSSATTVMLVGFVNYEAWSDNKHNNGCQYWNYGHFMALEYGRHQGHSDDYKVL